MVMHAGDAGFSLVEMVVSIALMLVMTSAIFALLDPAQPAAQAQPEAMDMQQRARVGADAMFEDLVMAGAGVYAGPLTGPLGNALPPIVPRIAGLQHADAATVARADAVTLFYVPPTYSQTTIAMVGASQTPTVILNTAPNCPQGQPACGLQTGADVMIFDGAGHFDAFAVTAVQSATAKLQHHATDAAFAYPSGSAISEVIARTYYFDAANLQLHMYDGYQSDTPVIDNVVGLTVSYYGDPQPPTQPKPPIGVENCLYDVAGQPKPLPTLGAGASLVELPLGMLSDGPWCGAGTSQFDVDLLRIRRVRVSLRVQVGPAAFRGTSPIDFARPGSSRGGSAYVPDLTLTFSVTPRNLNLGR